MDIDDFISGFLKSYQRDYIYHSRGHEDINGDGTTIFIQRFTPKSNTKNGRERVGYGIDCSNLIHRYLLSSGVNAPYLSTSGMMQEGKLSSAAKQHLEQIQENEIKNGDFVHFRGDGFPGHIGVVSNWDPIKKVGRIVQAGVKTQISEQVFSLENGFFGNPVEGFSRINGEAITPESRSDAERLLNRLRESEAIALKEYNESQQAIRKPNLVIGDATYAQMRVGTIQAPAAVMPTEKLEIDELEHLGKSGLLGRILVYVANLMEGFGSTTPGSDSAGYSRPPSSWPRDRTAGDIQAIEQERIRRGREREERDRQERDRQERDRQERDRQERDRQERERQARERLERDRQERERRERDRQARERQERERQASAVRSDREFRERQRERQEREQRERQNKEQRERQEREQRERQNKEQRERQERERREREKGPPLGGGRLG